MRRSWFASLNLRKDRASATASGSSSITSSVSLNSASWITSSVTACVAVSMSISSASAPSPPRRPAASALRRHARTSASERSATFQARRSSAEPFTEAVPILRYAIHCSPEVFTNAAWSSRKNLAMALTPRSGNSSDLATISSRAIFGSTTCRMVWPSICTSCTPAGLFPYSSAHSSKISCPPCAISSVFPATGSVGGRGYVAGVSSNREVMPFTSSSNFWDTASINA